MSGPVVVHNETIGAVALSIVIDPDPLDPRAEFDNAAVMACWHRRYRLGDAEGPARLRDAIRSSRSGMRADQDDLNDPHSLKGALVRCPDIVWLPLYLYDHSGITMSTSRGYPFNDHWDAGQVGFVFMTRAQVLAELATPAARRLTPKLRARAEALMRAEVATYDQYLTGDVYGYIIENDIGEHVDSCRGYLGREDCLDEGRLVARHLAEGIAVERHAALADELEAGRPDLYGDAADR